MSIVVIVCCLSRFIRPAFILVVTVRVGSAGGVIEIVLKLLNGISDLDKVRSAQLLRARALGRAAIGPAADGLC